MIFEIPITLIDPDTKKSKKVMALIDNVTGETRHVPLDKQDG